MTCFGVGLFGFILTGALCFLNWCNFFLDQVREVFCHYFFKQFLYTLLLSLFSLQYPMMWILLGLILSQRSLKPSSFLLTLFFFMLSFGGYCYLVLWFADSALCSIKSAAIFFQCILHFRYCIFNSDWFFFVVSIPFVVLKISLFKFSLRSSFLFLRSLSIL